MKFELIGSKLAKAKEILQESAERERNMNAIAEAYGIKITEVRRGKYIFGGFQTIHSAFIAEPCEAVRKDRYNEYIFNSKTKAGIEFEHKIRANTMDISVELNKLLDNKFVFFDDKTFKNYNCGLHNFETRFFIDVNDNIAAHYLKLTEVKEVLLSEFLKAEQEDNALSVPQ